MEELADVPGDAIAEQRLEPAVAECEVKAGVDVDFLEVLLSSSFADLGSLALLYVHYKAAGVRGALRGAQRAILPRETCSCKG